MISSLDEEAGEHDGMAREEGNVSRPVLGRSARRCGDHKLVRRLVERRCGFESCDV